MTTWINTTHSTLSGANKALCLDEITAKQYGSGHTKSQTKTVERELKALHKAGLLESTPGRGGLPHYSLITTTAPADLQPKPSAAAVAVYAALEGGTEPGPDIAAQLREAHAERLAMSQTIIAICCAIGRDPGQTTTTELQQHVKDAITEARNSTSHEMAVALGKIRKAIGDDTNEIDLHALDLHIGHDYAMAKRDMQEHRDLREALVAITDELFEYYQWYELPWAVRIMGQLIDAQHTHIHTQALQIEHLKGELTSSDEGLMQQELEITELRAKLEAQVVASKADLAAASERIAKSQHQETSTEPAAAEAPAIPPAATNPADHFPDTRKMVTPAPPAQATPSKAPGNEQYLTALRRACRSSAPMFFITPALTRLIARWIASKVGGHIPDDASEPDCISAIVAYLTDTATHQGEAALEELAQALNINPAEIREAHTPAGHAVSSPVRYRHPHIPGLTWTGKGKKPQWVTAWLADGNPLADLESHQEEHTS